MKINYEDFVRHLYHFFRIYSSELIRAVSHVKVLVAWLCLTLCRPMDYSPPGSSVHGILQARILEWISIFLTQGWNPHLLCLWHWQTGS